jgi:hypothetical protein
VKQKDYLTLGIIVFVAGIFSIILSGKLFGGTASKQNLKSPVVQTISSSFPDMKNDSTYSSVFNSSALDPTQLIQIGTNQNPTSFNSSQ